MSDTVYLDAAASAPLDPRVLATVVEVLQEGPANASGSHGAARRAKDRIDAAREQVAALAGVGPAGVVFTSGATEANALALRGLRPEAGRAAVISCVTEHASVIADLTALQQAGRSVHLVGVDENGEIDRFALEASVGRDTLIVSVMAANNETGVLGDLQAAADTAHAAGALLHTDASQLLTWGGLPPDLDVDLVTVSGHKMHGPQGVGALVLGRRARRRLSALLPGGGQEQGLRGGTYNVAGIAGLGLAAELAKEEGPAAAERVRGLRDLLHEQLAALIPGLLLNGHPDRRLPNILNVALSLDDEIDAEAVLANTPELSASTGSACSAGTPGPSRVLRAMGLGNGRASASVRLSLSRMSTEEDVRGAVPLLVGAVHEVRRRQSTLERVLA